MEIKKEDFVKFHIVDTVFYALPVKFFNQAKYEEIEIVAEAEILIKKKQVEKAKKEAELAEKKRVAEEALIKQQEVDTRKKAAEELELVALAEAEEARIKAEEEAIATALRLEKEEKKAKLEALKAQKLKELAELDQLGD